MPYSRIYPDVIWEDYLTLVFDFFDCLIPGVFFCSGLGLTSPPCHGDLSKRDLKRMSVCPVDCRISGIFDTVLINTYPNVTREENCLFL